MRGSSSVMVMVGLILGSMLIVVLMKMLRKVNVRYCGCSVVVNFFRSRV